MGWFGSSKRKVEKPINLRIETEDMIDGGYTCKEIAAELGTDEETVYRIKSAKQRRAARFSGKSISDDGQPDRLAQLREELAATELQDKIDEAKHNAYLREQERKEIEAENIEELLPTDGNPDAMITNLLMTAMLKNKQPTDMKSPEVVAGVVTPSPAQPPPTFEQIKQGIKTGMVGREQFTETFKKMANANQDDADKIYDYIKRKL